MRRKAIFLDRDGVINRERGTYTFRKEDFEFNADVFTVLKKFLDEGFLLIIVSNQGGIAKGLYSREETEDLHALMLSDLESRHISIAEVYYCPHHSDLEACLCRKPGSLLLEKAIARFGIDAESSFLIGDHERDAEAAGRVNIQAILIGPNQSLWKAWEVIMGGKAGGT